MELGDRIRHTLKRGGLTPRHLGGAIKIHFVTIYRTIDGGVDTSPLNKQVLTEALDKIDRLIEAGQLPMREKLNRVEKTTRLSVLLANHN
jgi:hypothetical protein